MTALVSDPEMTLPQTARASIDRPVGVVEAPDSDSNV
jgi:hypothetical protein